MVLVADTSALVSLAITSDIGPVQLLFQGDDVRIPPAIVDELCDIAAYNDRHADAAQRILDRIDDEHVQRPPELPDYPLDEGETAAIELANVSNADVFLCDEYHELSTIHALLSEARLVTTPKLIESFVVRGTLSPNEARTALSEMIDERSWRSNSYVEQFMNRFDE